MSEQVMGAAVTLQNQLLGVNDGVGRTGWDPLPTRSHLVAENIKAD